MPTTDDLDDNDALNKKAPDNLTTSISVEPKEDYVVVDSRFGPIASGSKESCVAFIAASVVEQAEQMTGTPKSFFRIQKVRRLGAVMEDSR